MSHDATLRVLGNLCTVHGYHWPPPVRTVKHHIEPQEFGGPTTPANLVFVCDTGHYSIHAALDAMLLGKPVPKTTRAELKIAQQGYDLIHTKNRPSRLRAIISIVEERQLPAA